MELFVHSWKEKKEDLPSIVLLHGMGGTGKIWRPVAVGLEPYFNVLAPDQRAHGKSQAIPSQENKDFTPLRYGRDVYDTLSVFKALPTWVIGHSMGVRTSLAFAKQDPSQIKGLILVDLGFSGTAGGGIGEKLYTFLDKLPESFPSRNEARDHLNTHCPDPSIVQYLMAVLTRESEEKYTLPFHAKDLMKTVEQARGTPVREWVAALSKKIPILALRGETSTVWKKEDFETEKKLFQSDRFQFLEVKGAGHGLPFEKRKEFIEITLNFIQNDSG